MSGVLSSQRQWASKRVRALAAILLALAMLIPVIGVASAQELPAQPEPYPPENELCIEGTIINFDEELVTNDYLWQVTATAIDPAGASVLTDVDEGEFKFEGLTPGLWSLTVTRPSLDWEFVAPYTETFEVTLDYGQDTCAQVRFKVKRPIDVWVYKIDDNHGRLEGWTIRAEPADYNWFASPVEAKTDADGLATFRLTEGKWIFTEKAPNGQHYTAVMPSDGRQEVDIQWDEAWDNGEVGKITLRFKNRLDFKGCIEVTKVDVPPEGDALGAFGLPDWKITIKRPNGSVAASGYTDAMGEIKFSSLPYGPYIVEEESRLGWEPVGPSSYKVDVSQPGTGDNAVCEEVNFFNRQSPPGFCIDGRKIDANGHVGIPDWLITATPVYKGAYPNEDIDGFDKLEATTDGEGKYRFTFPDDDYRIPSAAYKVCEEKRDGWLPHTSTCQTVYLPSKPGACVKAWDFVNQQVGHSESVYYGGSSSSSSSGSGCSTTHTVVAGESLFGIGNAYGVSGSEMLAANPWVYNRPNHYLYVGDQVCIP